MARVTVEDCLEKIPNRFVLSILAAKRTKQLLSGSKANISDVENKLAVVALREIANGDVREATEEEAEQIVQAQANKKARIFRRSDEEISIADAITLGEATSICSVGCVKITNL